MSRLSHAATDIVGKKKERHDYYDVCECVRLHLFACVSLFGYKSDAWCGGGLVPPITAPRLSPRSFYRKLIGGCHWCVKLLCVGHRRQLDYLFFIFTILEQLPSALLLFWNEILFPSAAFKHTVCNCFWNVKLSGGGGGGLVFYLWKF